MVKILYNKEIFESLASNCQTAKTSIFIMSSFCKLNALKEMDKYVSPLVKNKRLVVRFQYSDIVSGASDLEIYNYCKMNKWELYFDLKLHTKIYLFDGVNCIMGSSNLTQKGMGLVSIHNNEMASEYKIDNKEFSNVISWLKHAVLINDDIFSKMIADKKIVSNDVNTNWSNEILQLFNLKVDSIFASELPQKKYFDNLNNEDCNYLCYEKEVDRMNIKEAFKTSKAYNWLCTQLRKKENKEMYFGELTVALHNQLVNDPKPYRKDVKILLANLLDWTNKLASDEIVIDVPNYSTRIKLR